MPPPEAPRLLISEEIRRIFKDLGSLLSSSQSMGSALILSQTKPLHTPITCFFNVINFILPPTYNSAK